MEIKVSRVTYRIDLSKKQYDKLETLSYLDIVLPFFQKLGCIEVDYSGHYGPMVFLTFKGELKKPKELLKHVEILLGVK